MLNNETVRVIRDQNNTHQKEKKKKTKVYKVPFETLGLGMSDYSSLSFPLVKLWEERNKGRGESSLSL